MTSYGSPRNTSTDGKIHPGEHLPLRIMSFPKEGEQQSPPVTLQGGKTPISKAYVFHYAYDILVRPEVADPRDVQMQGHRVTIYPPFRGRATGLPYVESISTKTLPYRSNTTPPDFEWLGEPVNVTAQPDDYALRRDSLRIDCPSELRYEFAEDIAENLIDLIRANTNQWWIKRGRDNPRTHVRHWFEANELGERLGGVGTFAFFYGKLGFERPIDSNVWNNILTDLVGGKRIPLSWDTFLDGVYFHAADDLRRCLLELGISNEVLLTETVDKWEKRGEIDHAKVKQLFGGNDYLVHLSRVGKIRERSFELEHPMEFEWIKAIWVSRGKLAHGNPPIAHGARLMTLKDGPSIFASVLELRRWLEEI
jgi:hypothetical protein